ncbi:2-phospho-L-lactate guanylyltransferase [uncultured Cellulomonas sp.]|uniref:2-phospho-L-lactate guanylyltransferase n=1 Tax=uncultured Cellulomonas sp. TaxID=189682 RepID=UPI00262D1680|nr:2-phospho-L-lactate guanylyltransferase [uncultured Cellulomonas sp.]
MAVVPLRDGTSGKSRLAGALAGPDRAALVVALARHVVATLVAADDVDRVLVVTADTDFARTALSGVHGPGRVLEVVGQPTRAAGLDAAVDAGRARALRGAAAARLLVIHADLAALTRDDVAALLAAGGGVTLAPDRAGTGTNALVLDPAGAGFTFRFGPGSGAAHRQEAVHRGLPVSVVRRPGTSVDLDTVGDWHALPAGVRARLAAQVPAMADLHPGTPAAP